MERLAVDAAEELRLRRHRRLVVQAHVSFPPGVLVARLACTTSGMSPCSANSSRAERTREEPPLVGVRLELDHEDSGDRRLLETHSQTVQKKSALICCVRSKYSICFSRV